MVKSVNPWLRSLLRAGKKQQRTVARAITSLLAAPKPRVKAKPKPPPKPTPTTAGKRTARPAGAPAAPAAGKWLASHYSGLSDNPALPVKRMRYWLYLPDKVADGAPLPLVVMLHGCEQSATQFAQGTRMNQLAGRAGYAVLYPQQSLASHPKRCWKWYDRATQEGGGDVPLIVGIVGKVMARYPIDRSRIYIGGLSAGAGMAHIVALNHPELFAGIGLHSGPIFGAGHSMAGALAVMRRGASGRVDSAIGEVLEKRPAFPAMPTILIQGEDDQVVHPVNQVQLERQAMLLNGLPPGSPVEVALKVGKQRGLPYELRDVYRERTLMLRVARIARLKHAWSGGDERLSFNSGAGPDASRMLLDFFARHQRRNR